MNPNALAKLQRARAAIALEAEGLTPLETSEYLARLAEHLDVLLERDGAEQDARAGDPEQRSEVRGQRPAFRLPASDFSSP